MAVLGVDPPTSRWQGECADSYARDYNALIQISMYGIMFITDPERGAYLKANNNVLSSEKVLYSHQRIHAKYEKNRIKTVGGVASFV